MSDRVNKQSKYGLGDTGLTNVAPGIYASKGDLVVELFGITDECNAKAGWIIHQLKDCQEYPCIYEEVQIREITEAVMNSVNNLAAVTYTRFDIESYKTQDDITLDLVTKRIEEIRDVVGNAKEFIHVGYSGEMELVLNDFRVALRALERTLVRLYQSPEFQEYVFLKRYLSIINRTSLWAYWEARLAGNLYRLHKKQEGDIEQTEQYWSKSS